MSDRPERIFLTDAFEDMEDGLFWVTEREAEDDTEYIRKDIADREVNQAEDIVQYIEECNSVYAKYYLERKLQEILQPLRKHDKKWLKNPNVFKFEVQWNEKEINKAIQYIAEATEAIKETLKRSE